MRPRRAFNIPATRRAALAASVSASDGAVDVVPDVSVDVAPLDVVATFETGGAGT